MSRIKNKIIYPLKPYPKLTDYVVGSSQEEFGKTVNFEVGALAGVLSGGGLPDGIISGAYQWVVGTLSFNISAIVYRIGGIVYTTDPVTVTLNDGGALGRKDVIAVTTDREVIVIEGTESANPAKPVLTDATSQLEFTFVDIAAFATVPTGVSVEVIYNEGLGTPTEYNATENTSNVRIQIDNLDIPSDGVKGIKINDPNTGDILSFAPASPITVNTSDYLQFQIYLVDPFLIDEKVGNPLQGTDGLRVLFYNGGVPVSNTVTLTDGLFNLNGALLDEYQLISIPFDTFSFTGVQYDEIRILPNLWYRDGALYIDEVERVSGLNGADTQLINHSDLFLDDGTNPHGTTLQNVINEDGYAPSADLSSYLEISLGEAGAGSFNFGTGAAGTYVDIYSDATIVRLKSHFVTNNREGIIRTNNGVVDLQQSDVNGSTTLVFQTISLLNQVVRIPNRSGVLALEGDAPTAHTHLIAEIIDFTDNSTNWNTAFGWGDHIGLYASLVHTHVIADITDYPTSIPAYITDAPTIALLVDTANWNIDGVYGGTVITGTFQGQKYVNTEYFFEATADNVWIRLIRG